MGRAGGRGGQLRADDELRLTPETSQSQGAGWSRIEKSPESRVKGKSRDNTKSAIEAQQLRLPPRQRARCLERSSRPCLTYAVGPGERAAGFGVEVAMDEVGGREGEASSTRPPMKHRRA